MTTQYYEVVFEGHHKAIIGMLEGFILGSGNDWNYFFSDAVGVKSETFSELLLEWITMRTKLHHVILPEDFAQALQKALEKKELKHVKKEYVKSSQKIKEASFSFEAKTYGRTYAAEIKALINNLPEGLTLHNYSPVEKVVEDAKGVEMYAPEHDYIFETSGMLKGNIGSLIEIRKKMSAQPLITMKDIEITF